MIIMSNIAYVILTKILISGYFRQKRIERRTTFSDIPEIQVLNTYSYDAPMFIYYIILSSNIIRGHQ